MIRLFFYDDQDVFLDLFSMVLPKIASYGVLSD